MQIFAPFVVNEDFDCNSPTFSLHLINWRCCQNVLLQIQKLEKSMGDKIAPPVMYVKPALSSQAWEAQNWPLKTDKFLIQVKIKTTLKF